MPHIVLTARSRSLGTQRGGRRQFNGRSRRRTPRISGGIGRLHRIAGLHLADGGRDERLTSARSLGNPLRVLVRWAGFLGSVYLATYGQKLEQSGETTVVTTGSGGTTSVTQQPQYSARQINEIALGRMGGEVANELRKGLSRPNTVTVKAHAEVGVLILAAPSRAQQLREAQQGG